MSGLFGQRDPDRRRSGRQRRTRVRIAHPPWNLTGDLRIKDLPAATAWALNDRNYCESVLRSIWTSSPQRANAFSGPRRISTTRIRSTGSIAFDRTLMMAEADWCRS